MLKSCIILIFPIFLLPCAFTATAREAGSDYEMPPFSRYQVILDRMPFGALPANFNPDGGQPLPEQTPVEVQVEQQKLAQQVKMSCVNISPAGELMVGFSDLSAKPNKTYYLSVGDDRDGWKVVSADYDKEWAKLAKEGVEITLKLGKGLVEDQEKKVTQVAAGEKPAPEAVPIPLRERPRLLSRRSVSFRSRLDRGKGEAPALSYTERIKARAKKASAEQAARDLDTKNRLLKLAREAAQAEIKRQNQEQEEERLQQERATGEGGHLLEGH